MDRRDALVRLGAALTGMALGAGPPAGRGGDEGPRARRIPGTGEALPVIGLGTWQAFDVGRDAAARAPLAEVLRAFVELGGRLVDSSPMYGRAESVVGDLAAELGLGGRLFLATKVWTTGREAGVRQMLESMRRLRTERIDLLQVHNLVNARTHLETLAAWKREGRIRYLGVTHYTARGQEEVAAVLERHAVDFVQINYSAGEREAERRLLPLAAERGVAVIANRPFAGGGLLRDLRSRPLPAIAGELGCSTWAQLLLKFVVGHPAVTCAIPATSNPAHLRDNVAAGRGRLPDEAERGRIAAAASAR
jgi:diketogulonate reductase-like aldo/keto reductase